MAKFGREGKKEVPAFTTASMSDIVFMRYRLHAVVLLYGDNKHEGN